VLILQLGVTTVIALLVDPTILGKSSTVFLAVLTAASSSALNESLNWLIKPPLGKAILYFYQLTHSSF
jgi:hypothetical protein